MSNKRKTEFSGEVNGTDPFTPEVTNMLAYNYLTALGHIAGVHLNLALPRGTARPVAGGETEPVAGVLLGIDLTSAPKGLQLETIKFLRSICPEASADIDAVEQLLNLNEPTIRILED